MKRKILLGCALVGIGALVATNVPVMGQNDNTRTPASTTAATAATDASTQPMAPVASSVAADRSPTQQPSGPAEISTGTSVTTRGGKFYVNGQPFFVKGIGYSPARPGSLPWKKSVPLSVLAHDFAQIREAGFNTLRTWTPLRPEALVLAKEHGLMVLQGIWIDRPRDFTSTSYRLAMSERITEEIRQLAGHDNVLGVLVGNELPVEHVHLAGLEDTEALLQSMYDAVKAIAPNVLVSFANWPDTALLDQSFFDFISYNTYDYNPLSVAHSLGYRGYLQHLKATQAQDKPLLITEFGLSVSPFGTGRPGYGGNSLEQQSENVLALYNDIIQSGAAGGCVFEWMDEWWKNYDYPGDEKTHDESDPEEWFGLLSVTEASQLYGAPRPILDAITAQNRALLLGPRATVVTGEVSVEVYNSDVVAAIDYRIDDGEPQALTKQDGHMWLATWDTSQADSGVRRMRVEARNAAGDALTSTTRHLWNAARENPHGLPWQVEIVSDSDTVRTGGKLVPVTFDVQVTNVYGQPVANQPVFYAISEPQIAAALSDVQDTDAQGVLRVKYLVREDGIISCSAGVEFSDGEFSERYGNERFIVVRAARDAVVAAPIDVGTDQSAATVPAFRGSVAERLGPLASLAALPTPAWVLTDPGMADVIDYTQYGTFVHEGERDYHFKITDQVGLSKAVGEGIYPNDISVYRNPAYGLRDEAGDLEGTCWDFVNIADTQLAFLKWATTGEEPGVKLFYTAIALERAGHIRQAIRAYYAVLVHYPQSIGWTFFQTPWSVGKGALDRVYYLTRLYPELGLKLVGADINMRGGFDNNADNDVFIVSPGRLVSCEPSAVEDVSPVEGLEVVAQRGTGAVQLHKYANGHWALQVHGKPFQVKGITYDPTKVGESPDMGNMREWTKTDANANDVLDVYETWVDANGNNQQDADEPIVGDFALLQQMGVNTLRMYHHGAQHQAGIDTAVLRSVHEQYGMYVIMGDFVGMYTVGSGATWEAGTDYRNEEQRANMRQSVQSMVRAHKDEPYLLMWVLGNENNYGGMHGFIGGVGNAGKYPAVYYAFLNELAEWIHEVDPDHPVMVGNGEVLYLDVLAEEAPALDVIGLNSYRGSSGFSHTLWKDIQRVADRPGFVTEYGCPAYHEGQPQTVAEREQAQYHLGNWLGIEQNTAGRGVGIAIGGGVFEWIDEWWKAGQPPYFDATVHEPHGGWAGPFPGGWSYEEWFGVASQGDGSHSPFLRQLRVTYHMYQRLWTRE